MNYATIDSVGDWDGDEQLAADNFNLILEAIGNFLTEERIETQYGGNYDIVSDAAHWAWDDWGSDAKLLTITEDEITAYVQQKLG